MRLTSGVGGRLGRALDRRTGGGRGGRTTWPCVAEVPLVNVSLPAYKPGCDTDPAKVACDYPEYKLNKIVSTKFASSGSPAYTLIKKFNWTNEDQNLVAKYIAEDKMTPDAAAKKWVDANADKVKSWL